jgi:predicted dehydrogenase
MGKHPATAGARRFDDYRRMLDEARPDVVGVFMPLYRNAEASLAAAEHGCHIITEKPLATELDDLLRLRQAVRSAGVRAAALMNHRGEGPFLAAREAVSAGRIGRPVLAFGQKSYPFGSRGPLYAQRRTYGGSIPWQAIHAIDFIRYCTGRRFVRAAAMQSNAEHPTHPGMEDNGGILLQLGGPSAGHAVISFDFLRPHTPGSARKWGDDRLRIVGSEGIVEVTAEGTAAVLMTAGAVEPLPLPASRDVVLEFLASLQGRGEGLISTDDSFAATHVALVARQAADSGQVLPIEMI